MNRVLVILLLSACAALGGKGNGVYNPPASGQSVIQFTSTNTLPVAGETLTNLTGNPVAVLFTININASGEKAAMVVGTATQCFTRAADISLGLPDDDQLLVGFINTQQTYGVTALVGTPTIVWYSEVQF